MGMVIAVSVYALMYCMVLHVILEKQTGRLIAAGAGGAGLQAERLVLPLAGIQTTSDS